MKNNIGKLKKVAEILKDAATELKELLPNVKAQIDSADEVGKKAAEENNKTPSDCMCYFPEDRKRTKEELEEIKAKIEEEARKEREKKEKKDKKNKK